MIITGEEHGLNLNKSKTKIIQIRGIKKLLKIGEYDIEVKYQGIKIRGKIRGRKIFLAENKTWIEKVEKNANGLIPQKKFR